MTVSTAWSFDRASVKLKDICHMNTSDDTIERVCQHEGEEARKWLRDNRRMIQAFAQAPGEPEFYSDGLKINTTGGWREMRLNLLQKRERGASAPPEKWNDRVLPQASVRLASCCIADCRLTGGDVETVERAAETGRLLTTQRDRRWRAVDLGAGSPAAQPQSQLVRGRLSCQ